MLDSSTLCIVITRTRVDQVHVGGPQSVEQEAQLQQVEAVASATSQNTQMTMEQLQAVYAQFQRIAKEMRASQEQQQQATERLLHLQDVVNSQQAELASVAKCEESRAHEPHRRDSPHHARDEGEV
jgi:hypothetical protein